MIGKIIKGIAGFYYVYVDGRGVFECKAKGSFRKMGLKPLVGDNVELAILDENEKKGNVERILPRKNELIRPAVSNIDRVLIIFSMARPEPNLNLLDRFLIMMEFQKVPVTICFNKEDLGNEAQKCELRDMYERAGYELLFYSAKEEDGIREIERVIEGKTIAVTGPSGVGKSTTVNRLQTQTTMETQDISEKLRKGKNTTRHSEILPVNHNTFIVDTPGFTALDVPGMEAIDLWRYYPEFVPYEANCRFIGCSHVNERDCGIKDAVEKELIHRKRYEAYVMIYNELKNMKKY